MKPWFRVYNTILNHPKILGLSLENQALFIKFLAVSNVVNGGGMLPELGIISKMVGQRIDKTRSAAKAMVRAGLLTEDTESGALAIVGWRTKQFESDDATARSQRSRGTKCNVADRETCNVAKQSPRVRATDTETDTEREREPPCPPFAVVGEDGETQPVPGCTEAEIGRLRDLAWDRLSDLTGGDLWIARCLQFAQRYPADWIEALISETAKTLAKPDGHRTKVAWAEATLRDWAIHGGPPAWATPVKAATGRPRGEPAGRRRGPSRPPSEHAVKMERYEELVTWGEQEDTDAGETMGRELDEQAHHPAPPARRSQA